MTLVGLAASVLTLTAVMINAVCFSGSGSYGASALRARLAARFRGRPRMFAAVVNCMCIAFVLDLIYIIDVAV